MAQTQFPTKKFSMGARAYTALTVGDAEELAKFLLKKWGSIQQDCKNRYAALNQREKNTKNSSRLMHASGGLQCCSIEAMSQQ
jgi:hypothetical protein